MSAPTCPACNEVNSTSAETCSHCGASLRSLESYSEHSMGTAPNIRTSFLTAPPIPAPTPAVTDWREGQQVAHYTVERLLGKGGMGSVWRATDTRLRRAVALKFLPPQLSSDPKTKARFVREAQTASALDHPNIATVYEIGEHGDSLYLAMALYEGETLQQRIARSPIPCNEIESILAQIASGLAAAHSAGIIHRDLKPANVMLTRSGLVKILDFGLAKLVSASDSEGQVLTKTGHVMGTVSYMSPQQAEGRPLDHRTDLWSLGVVAYEMLCRQRPFDSEFTGGTLARILVSEPQRPSELRPDMPPRLEGLVTKLLQKDPAARVQSAAEVVAELSPSGSNPGVDRPSNPAIHQNLRPALGETRFQGLPVENAVSPARQRPGSTRRLWIAVATALILAAAAAVGFGLRGRRADQSVGPSGTPELAILAIRDNTGDASLAQAGIGSILSDALVQVLNDYHGVYTISPARLYSQAQMLGRTYPDTASDSDLARQVCDKTGANLMLTGFLSKLGESFVLSVTVTELPSERHIATLQASASKESELLEKLPVQIITALQERLNATYGTKMDGESSITSMGTTNLEAYAHLTRGMEFELDNNWDDALAEFQSACRLDPQWAVAWSLLSCAASYSGKDELFKEASEKAMQLSEHANEKDRQWIRSSRLWNEASGDQFVQAMRDYVARWPDDRNAHLFAGFAERWLLKRCDRALEWYQEAYELTPDYYYVSKEIAECQAELGHPDAAIAALERYIRLGRGSGLQKAREAIERIKAKS